MNQRLIGSPGQESSYNIDIDDARELVALLGEAPDVPTKGFTGLLSAVLEVPWVPRVLVCALEVPTKISFMSAQLWILLDDRCSNHVRAELAKNNGRLWTMKSSLSAPLAWQAS